MKTSESTMQQNLVLTIRTTENGFIARFSDDRYPFQMDDKEYVALTPRELGDVITSEFGKRLGVMIDGLTEKPA